MRRNTVGSGDYPGALQLFKNKRYLVYSILTILIWALPFIRIGGNHILLLSFERRELHIMGTSFSAQELYLMPFLLIMLFMGILFITNVGGRVWCGWNCPQTIFRSIFRDLIQTKLLKLRRRVDNKQQKIDLSSPKNKAKYYCSLALFAIVAMLASSNFLMYFVPPEEFIRYASNPSEHTVLYGFWIATAAIIISVVCLIEENFCIYMCPYARVQSVLFDRKTVMPVYDVARGGVVYEQDGSKNAKLKPEDECVSCNRCVNVCPTHIDIRKGMQLECINCLECVDACTKTMGSLGKVSLIRWSSPVAVESGAKLWGLIRAKSLSYMGVLGMVFCALLFVSTGKEGMLLSINRTTELYSIRSNGAIDNSYKILLQNTDKVEHTFRLELVGSASEEFDFIRPTDMDIKIRGNSSAMVVVVLRAKGNNRNNINDEKIPIQMRSYDVQASETRFAVRDTVFIFPGSKTVTKAREKV